MTVNAANAVDTKNILLIDDDKLILGSLSKVFIRFGWNVQACSDGEEGLSYIARNKYDCVLLDIRMPNMDGVQVLERLRALEKENHLDHQRVIILTGYADADVPAKTFELEAYRYLHKPVDIEVLVRKAEECLNIKSLEKTLDAPSDGDIDKTFKRIRKSYANKDLHQKVDIVSKKLGIPLKHIDHCTYDTEQFKGNIENPIGTIQVPLALIGPLAIDGANAKGDFHIPFATTEGALTLTYDLGARLLKFTGPVKTEVLSKGVHITPMFPVQGDEALILDEIVRDRYDEIKQVAEGQSSHAKLLRIEKERTARNYLLKFVYDTADAQGLNMINQASYNACKFIETMSGLPFYHRSHYSGIKHYSPHNFEKGQGRVVKASALVSSKALGMLNVTAEKMKDFFDRCIESATHAGIPAVNVHAANGITALYLACGQDMADISCSHSCATTVEIIDGKDLQIECLLHNLMLGTVGGGTGLGTQAECLDILGCLGSGKADKFAEIVAATVLAGEFPTAAAVISETYVDIHNKYGRNKSKLVRG